MGLPGILIGGSRKKKRGTCVKFVGGEERKKETHFNLMVTLGMDDRKM